MRLLNLAYSETIKSFPTPPGFPKIKHIPLVSDLVSVIFLELVPSPLPSVTSAFSVFWPHKMHNTHENPRDSGPLALLLELHDIYV